MRAERFIGRKISDWRGPPGARHWKICMYGVKAMAGSRWVPAVILIMSFASILSRNLERSPAPVVKNLKHNLWTPAPSFGWQASCAPRSPNWSPPRKSNGYLVASYKGGIHRQRIAICNAVLAARIMNATLLIPHLETSPGDGESGFSDIYDVNHFITSLKNDIRVVRSLPSTWTKGDKKMELKPFRLHPPRDASVAWYETAALERMKEHGALFLTPFFRPFAEEIDNHEYQRLRCRVNYHCLRFSTVIRSLSSLIVERLSAEGPYVTVDLGLDLDTLAYTGCEEMLNSKEKETLTEYRDKNFDENELQHKSVVKKCPLDPEEMGSFLQALGFQNLTRIYVAAGEAFESRTDFLNPLGDLFANLVTLSTVAMPDELESLNAEGRHGPFGRAIDYMVCLLSDIFISAYDRPRNFANNLIGQRLYYGFRTTLQPDRNALAPAFTAYKSGRLSHLDFESKVRMAMSKTTSGSPHVRVPLDSFYSNPWPECFCMNFPSRTIEVQCPSRNITNPSYDEDEDDNLGNWNI